MMKKLTLVLILVLSASSFLCADIYVKIMERTEAHEMMGRKNPERIEIKERWLGKNKFFVQFSKEFSVIVDYEKEKMYFIAHRPRHYYEFSTNIDKTNLQEYLSPEIAKGISSTKITDFKVKLSGQTKRISNWNCYGTDFEFVIMIPALNLMAKYKFKIWMTKDLPFDYEDYTRGMDEFFERYILGMVNIDEDSKKEMEKLEKVDGFQVAVEATVRLFGSEIRIESQCLEVVEKAPPPDIYSVPRDYTKKTLNFALGLLMV
jgi:hypothetical protein